MSLRLMTLMLFLLFFVPGVVAQTPAPSPSPSPSETPEPQQSPRPSLEKEFLKNILRDQRAIWVSPFRMGGGDMRWVAPLSVGSVALIFTDRSTTRGIREYHDQIPLSIYVSKVATSTGYAAAAFYFIGRATGNRRAKETGILAGEAVLDSLIVSQSIKGVTQRPRPLRDGGRGRFFTGGNSFPSGHAMAVWAFASVVADEYKDRRLVRFGAYGVAAVVSAARFTGNRHFLSEVLVGSVIGYGIGQYVYRTHHRASVPEMMETERRSKLFPMIAPNYSPGLRQYGVTLAWNF